MIFVANSELVEIGVKEVGALLFSEAYVFLLYAREVMTSLIYLSVLPCESDIVWLEF